VRAFRDRSEDEHTRYYLCIQVYTYNAEIVLSIFLRLCKSQSKLFIEWSQFLLPSFKRAFIELDASEELTAFEAVRETFMGSVVGAPFIVLLAIFRVIGFLISPLDHYLSERRRKKEI